MAAIAIYYQHLYRIASTNLSSTTQELSASRTETLKWVEKASKTDVVTHTITVTRPGETVVETVEKIQRVEVAVEKTAQIKEEKKETVKTVVAAPVPAADLFSISVYKPANLNVKDWQADFGLKVDAIGAEAVIGGRGDVTSKPTEYYGGLRWRI